MKKQPDSNSRLRTRRAILEAMVDVIMRTDGIGFSVQAVADRAGVTHRTIYNHFPTREGLCDAFADYVDETLAQAIGADPEPGLALATLPANTDGLYRTLGLRDRHARAYVMLMIGNRRPMTGWQRRSRRIEELVASEQSADAALPPQQVAAALRMFVSSMGWHLLTEQCGLTTEEAAATAAWATRSLLEAAIGKKTPKSKSRRSPGGANATVRRRR